MRIIKFPQFNICTCSECGTVFQPEAGDSIVYRFLNLSEPIAYIRCPTCDVLCELSKPDATDTNVGNK
jgi:hypothetical protein